MKNRRSVSLCIEGILLLIVLACSLAVRDTDTRPAAAAVRVGMSVADAAGHSVRDAAPLAVREST
ncbi:glycosyltransferase family 2 protein, partial [Paraburkholderia sp. SIMBA_061]